MLVGKVVVRSFVVGVCKGLQCTRVWVPCTGAKDIHTWVGEGARHVGG